jgi:hypothetical protein
MQKQRFLSFARQVDRIEFFERILYGLDHRSAPHKLQDHVADSSAADTADFVETADHPELLLDAATSKTTSSRRW